MLTLCSFHRDLTQIDLPSQHNAINPSARESTADTPSYEQIDPYHYYANDGLNPIVENRAKFPNMAENIAYRHTKAETNNSRNMRANIAHAAADSGRNTQSSYITIVKQNEAYASEEGCYYDDVVVMKRNQPYTGKKPGFLGGFSYM